MSWNRTVEASCRAAGYFEAAAQIVRRVWQPHGDSAEAVADAVQWARELAKLAERALKDMEYVEGGAK